jgi:Flp pilus assembly protein TadD
MTNSSRLAMLQRMAEQRPEDPRAYFGLALEHEKLGVWEDVVTALHRYLELTEDEGNAYGRLGHALQQLGREEEARKAYQLGIQAAYRHNHPTMAMEFEEILEQL